MALANSHDGYIFDFGGVLVHHQTDADQVRMAKVANINKERFTELYWATRLDYDKGLLTGTDYWNNIARGANTTLSAEQIAGLVEIDNVSWMQFDETMWSWVDRLRAAGKRVAMLSNMPRDLGETLKTRTKRLQGFHHVTLSYEVHAVKPEAIIYRDCLSGIGTAPQRTVFFDDRIENIEAAQKLGIDAVEFLERDAVLRRFGG